MSPTSILELVKETIVLVPQRFSIFAMAAWANVDALSESATQFTEHCSMIIFIWNMFILCLRSGCPIVPFDLLSEEMKIDNGDQPRPPVPRIPHPVWFEAQAHPTAHSIVEHSIVPASSGRIDCPEWGSGTGES